MKSSEPKLITDQSINKNLYSAPKSFLHGRRGLLPTLAKRKWTVFKSRWNWEHLNYCNPTQI